MNSTSNLDCVLAGLVERINNAAHASLTALRSSFEHACEAGQLLIEAKALVSHGGWSAWLAENTKISERTAQRWMRFARKGREAVVVKTDTVAVLTGAAMDAELHLRDEKVRGLAGGIAEMIDRQIELDEIDRSRLRVAALRARRKAWLVHAEEPPTREPWKKRCRSSSNSASSKQRASNEVRISRRCTRKASSLDARPLLVPKIRGRRAWSFWHVANTRA